jgi:hypothetical protein
MIALTGYPRKTTSAHPHISKFAHPKYETQIENMASERRE